MSAMRFREAARQAETKSAESLREYIWEISPTNEKKIPLKPLMDP